MREILRKDFLYKVGALVIAILLWFYVTNLQNPVIEKVIAGVSVEYTGLAEGLVLDSHTETVEVRVKGPDTIINPLTAKDLKIQVNLSGTGSGEAVLPLEQHLVKVPEGAEVVSTKPQNIQVYIDSVKEKQLPVYVEYTNTVAEDYSSFEANMTPSLVVVRGGSRLLENLESARVTVDLNNATENLELSLPVQLIDKSGKIASAGNLQISPDKIQVFVPVVKNTPTKTVIIKPVIIGKPLDGYVVTRTVVEPETMKITGAAEKIDSIDHILTMPIDVSGLYANKTFLATLEMPEGVTSLFQSMVKVLVQIEEAPITKTFTDVGIRLGNKPAGLKAVLSHEKVSVTVKGARADIEKLSVNSIQAKVDLQGVDPNRGKEENITYEVKVTLPDNIQLVKVEPGTVNIKLTPET